MYASLKKRETINSSQLSDQQLVLSCQAGEAWAQRELYNRYKNKMMAFCLRYFNRKELAEEFFQEGFVRFFNKINQFDINYPVYPWMKKTFLSAGINYLNKYYAANNPVDERVELPDIAFGNAEQEMINRLSYENLLDQLKMLKSEDALMINMALVDGLTHEEIGKILAISPGNSRIKLSRARKRFIELLTKKSYNQ